jgi:hypothetical protein
MPIRPPPINQQRLARAILYVKRRDKKRTELLTGKLFYLKPKYIPWAKELWITKTDVFLPSNFNEKSEKHQIMDIHRALSMFEEHEIFKDQHPRGWFVTWATSRKIGYVKRALNLRIRQLWRAFVTKFKFRLHSWF